MEECPRGDHPRSRGVYLAAEELQAWGAGSSPLARGLQRKRRHSVGWARIIPARAGFTFTEFSISARRKDHPRSRGVYDHVCQKTTDHAGSSPLARGLRPDEMRRHNQRRIIPARAGFTRCCLIRGGRRADHPRSRGVYDGPEQAGGDVEGSSPLARGLLNPISTSRSVTPDHPRSRGVYNCFVGSVCSCDGSSPLARGLRRQLRGFRVVRGIIPARAGFT